ncbi:MAG TPA: hypothetical protein VFB29_00465 [Pseudolabrys sp.]|nr:hypothetical protein [Pseudolabrys sp.]
MTIDPRVSCWLNVFAAVMLFTTGASADLTAIFGDKVASLIIHLCAYLGGIVAAVNAILHAIPSKPGATNEFYLGPKSPEAPKP